jgi:hypothetical protein
MPEKRGFRGGAALFQGRSRENFAEIVLPQGATPGVNALLTAIA